MAYLKFLKDNEPSIKKEFALTTQKLHKHKENWRLAFQISGGFNVLFMVYILYRCFNH